VDAAADSLSQQREGPALGFQVLDSPAVEAVAQQRRASLGVGVDAEVRAVERRLAAALETLLGASSSSVASLTPIDSEASPPSTGWLTRNGSSLLMKMTWFASATDSARPTWCTYAPW